MDNRNQMLSNLKVHPILENFHPLSVAEGNKDGIRMKYLTPT